MNDVHKSALNKGLKEQEGGYPDYCDTHGDARVALHVSAHAETQLCSALFVLTHQ